MKHLTLLGLVVLLVACGDTASDPASVSSPAVTVETNEEEKYRYWPSQGTAQIIYEVVTDSADAYQVQYPAITNLAVDHPVYQAVNVDFRADLDTFTQAATTFYDDSATGVSAGLSIPWDYSLEWLGGRYDRSLWSLAFQIFNYQGGETAQTFTKTLNYFPRTNQLLTFDDFFTSNDFQTPLVAHLKTELENAKTIRWEATEQPNPYDISADPYLQTLEFTPTLVDAWVVSERNESAGFLIFFEPLEVGQMTEGAYEVFVPLNLIESWLKPEYITIFD